MKQDKKTTIKKENDWYDVGWNAAMKEVKSKIIQLAFETGAKIEGKNKKDEVKGFFLYIKIMKYFDEYETK